MPPFRIFEIMTILALTGLGLFGISYGEHPFEYSAFIFAIGIALCVAWVVFK